MKNWNLNLRGAPAALPAQCDAALTDQGVDAPDVATVRAFIEAAVGGSGVATIRGTWIGGGTAAGQLRMLIMVNP